MGVTQHGLTRKTRSAPQVGGASAPCQKPPAITGYRGWDFACVFDAMHPARKPSNVARRCSSVCSALLCSVLFVLARSLFAALTLSAIPGRAGHRGRQLVLIHAICRYNHALYGVLQSSPAGPRSRPPCRPAQPNTCTTSAHCVRRPTIPELIQSAGQLPHDLWLPALMCVCRDRYDRIAYAGHVPVKVRNTHPLHKCTVLCVLYCVYCTFV